MSKATILVVDDDIQLNKAIVLGLEREGYTVASKSDAASGMDALLKSTAPPDLVITDVCMPGADGISFLAMAKSTFPQLPFIVITALPQEETKQSAAAEGAEAFLRKPFDKKMLLLTVERILKDSKRRAIGLRKNEGFQEGIPSFDDDSPEDDDEETK